MNKASTTIYLVRHGQSTTNLAGVIGGQLDPDLTPTGIEQAEATKAKLAKVNFDDVYSSDLRRAVKTAGIIYGTPVPKDHRLEDLRERNYGALEGQPEHHFHAYLSALLVLSPDDRWHYKHVDDMESDHELIGRFMKGLEHVAKNNKGKTILVVAHGAAIRTVLFKLGHGHYEDLPPKSFKNGGYVELQHDGEFNVVSVHGVDSEVLKEFKS